MNKTFKTLASFLLALPAYGMGALGIAHNPDAVIIGALMLLVPGLLFTNAMRDIIFGDTNSGVNRIVQVLLIAVAIALGTAAAWSFSTAFLPLNASVPAIAHPYLLQCVASLIGCGGFAILFNIHGPGGMLCALGGLLVWVFYCVTIHFSGNALLANFVATVAAAIYSEIMARVRKYPAISYLVVLVFPLLPCAGIYYTISSFIQSDMDGFVSKGTETIAIAGVLAVGILLVSTTVRTWTEWKRRKKASV